MAKSIDPAFQAAPNLGPSSYDPIQFARRNRMEKFQIQRKQQEDQARNTAQGLENLMVDVKGWEDQQGFKEIMADQDRVMNGFMELSRKGMNLVSPKTTQEIMAYKAIQEAHAGIKQKVDTWNQQKGIYDLYTKAIEKDSTLPVEEQEIDHGASMANVQKVLKTKDIMGRGTGLQNLLVTKTKPVDVFHDIIANKDIFEKGTVNENIVDMPDGSRQINRVEDLTPQQTESNAKKAGMLFDSKPQSYKDAVRKIRESDPDPAFNVMSDKDYYKTMAVPTYKDRFQRTPVGKSGGLSIFGQTVKVEPALKNPNNIKLGDRNYTDHYDFNIRTPLIGINLSNLGAEVYEGGKWIPASKEGGLVNAQMNFYDPKTDSFIFTTTSDGMDAGVFKAQTFSVPRANLGKEVNNLPIKKDDGKAGKLSDIYGKVSTTSAKKKVYNPKTGKFE